MMLYSCVKCGNMVSDKGICCPKCGYPVEETLKKMRENAKIKARIEKQIPLVKDHITILEEDSRVLAEEIEQINILSEYYWELRKLDRITFAKEKLEKSDEITKK